MRLALVALLALAVVALHRFRRDVRAMEALMDDDEWMSELVPMGAWYPHTATFDRTGTVHTLAAWRN